ncbi:MBL fold metallo-hydrolase [Gephyromycinifex aptenodytis]|uniref:MBL fold metallo-hydrolase n=1 Tax=Gephyromycinifex aptenodytis TaxID=2716227 RepID=UPI0014463A8E|nr:MBL fold metallo-hydrolase [Gephyromycinifex aptenodytis]
MSAEPPPSSVPPGRWRGGSGSRSAVCVLAPNPSPMTLEGTNTWIIGAPDAPGCVVIDPGPDHPQHLRAILDEVGQRRIEAVLLTHRHPDHREGAPRLAEIAGVPVRAHGPGADELQDGDVLEMAGAEIAVLATPGHTSDSLCFLLADEEVLITGDTILGWGTTMVAWPDGRLGAYLSSLDQISALTGTGRITRLLPAHGAVLRDAHASVRYYLEHRSERLEQVRLALRDGAQDAQSVVETVYADVPRELWPAATMSVQAQLAYLREGH